jgi:transcriptional regulator with XRE-family HTH domain
MTPKELRSRRLALGWSREQLAANVGASLGAVAGWETGDRPIDSARAVDQLLRQFESSRVMLQIKRRGAEI